MNFKLITSRQFEDLAKLYPVIFEKSKLDSFDVGLGWYPIIENLLQLIYDDLDNANIRLSYIREHNTNKMTFGQFNSEVVKWESKVKTLTDEIPVIVEVREKFGGLRFSVTHGSEELKSYIKFAESLSLRTCEYCNNPGKPRNNGYIKTLCDKHDRLRDSTGNYDVYDEDFE